MPDDAPVTELIKTTIEGGVARITIDRPEAGNSLTSEMRDHLAGTFDELSATLGVRAVVLTGAGDRHFCTGAGLGGAQRAEPARPDGAPDRALGDVSRLIRRGWQRLVASILDCEKPVIAAVNGAAAGGGANLVLASDLVVMADSARLIEVFVKRGIIPDAGGCYLLPRIVGPQRAKELMFLGDDLSASECERWGIANRVVPAAELGATVEELAARLAAGPSKAIAMTKWLVNRSFESGRNSAFEEEAYAQELVTATADMAEGIAAFAERRDPDFKGWQPQLHIVDRVAAMSDDDQAAYLARLDLEPEPRSAAALARLHRAQVERVPYETLWIHTGQQWGVDLDESVARIARRRRGGYCFHLNGAFSVLLESLGYDVTRHVGGVHGPAGATEAEMANHLVLTVAGLPTDDNPDGLWYVDAGLGDALHEPAPLAAGPVEQPPFSMRLDETPDAIGDWHLTHDAAGGFVGMAWRSAPATIDDFRAKHEWLSAAPESGFVRVLTVQQRDATGVDILKGCILSRVGEGAAEADLTTQTELEDTLTDLFGLDLTDIDATVMATMWTRMQREHERWTAAGRP